jgi:hypothetical protein
MSTNAHWCPSAVERMDDALWPWAERLKPAIVWLRAAGYLVQAGSGGGSVRPRETLPVGGLFRQSNEWTTHSGRGPSGCIRRSSGSGLPATWCRPAVVAGPCGPRETLPVGVFFDNDPPRNCPGRLE